MQHTLKLNPDKTEFVVFDSKVQRAKLVKFCSCQYAWKLSETSRCSQKSGCMGRGYGGLATLSHGMPWLQLLMPLSAAASITVICLEVFPRTTLGNYRLYKIVLFELLPRLPNTHTYLQFTRNFIGTLLNITVF